MKPAAKAVAVERHEDFDRELEDDPVMSTQSALPGFGVALPEFVGYSVEVLRTFAPKDGSPVSVMFSGGKDSIVTLAMVREAGLAWNAVYNVTCVDPPELVQFIRREYLEVRFGVPAQSLVTRAQHRGLMPSRWRRWCCTDFKERPTPGVKLKVGFRSHSGGSLSRMAQRRASRA